MRMARVNVYLPDGLVREAKEAKLNISSLTQEAVRLELDKRSMNAWLNSLRDLPAAEAGHEQVMKALDEARDELWGPED